jgi:hypothetical protein
VGTLERAPYRWPSPAGSVHQVDRFDEALVNEALRILVEADPDDVSRTLQQLAGRLGATVAHTSGTASLTLTKGDQTLSYGLVELAGATGAVSGASGALSIDRRSLEELLPKAPKVDLNVELALVIMLLAFTSMGQVLDETHKGSDVTQAIIVALIAFVAAKKQLRGE